MTKSITYRLFASNEWSDKSTPLQDYKGKFTERAAADYLKTYDFDSAMLTDDDLKLVAEQETDIIPDAIGKRTKVKLLQFKDGKRLVIRKWQQIYVKNESVYPYPVAYPHMPFGATGYIPDGVWKDVE